MKTLSTSQQQELLEFFSSLPNNYDLLSPELNTCNYWAIELKPKRVRKKALDKPEEVV